MTAGLARARSPSCAARPARATAIPSRRALPACRSSPGATRRRPPALAALLLRETLETPGKTCALITPDRDLARRVSARLARWGVEADSSAGAPLSHSSVGVLLGLVAQAGDRSRATRCGLLALLKHPPHPRPGPARRGAGGRRSPALERRGLRGPRPADWDALRTSSRTRRPRRPLDLLDRAEQALDRLKPQTDADPPALHARRLVLAAEALARDEAGGLGALWAGPGGEAAAGLVTALIGEGEGLPPATPFGFALLLERLMASATVRAAGGAHPRLHVLGAIEARLVRADRLVLAGLEEGVWPQGAPIGSLPVAAHARAALGLPPPERRVGLSAHDFAQAACAGEVYPAAFRAARGRPGGAVPLAVAPTHPGRGRGTGPARPAGADGVGQGLGPPGGPYAPPRPEPRPPLRARPRELPVTAVEALTRDPYAVYARRVLNLRRLDRPDEPMEARARGTAIHAAFEAFARAWPGALPPDAAHQFQRLYLEALRKAGAPEAAMAREQALAREAGVWVAEVERRRRAEGPKILVEQERPDALRF